MHSYEQSSSPVFTRFFEPAADAYVRSARAYDCHVLPDLDFLEMGLCRVTGDARTGRDFLQRHGDHGRADISVDHFFKALKSSRRLANLRSVNALLAPAMAARAADPFAAFPELAAFALLAGDGHFHGAAVHDPVGTTSAGAPVKRATGHFFLLDLRTHRMDHLAHALKGGTRKTEHDMHALKRTDFDVLRGGTPKGIKVLLVWDRAGIDFAYWQKAKRTAGLYFLSREKENMNLLVSGNRTFDRTDARNAGVVADQLVSPGSGGAMLRRILYLDPLTGIEYRYLTTETTLPPGLLVLLYKQRWDIEKTFDEFKNKLGETKSWASGETAKTTHALFLCLAHNLMVLLEKRVLREEGVDNLPERKRKEERREEAIKRGANFVATALQRFTVRSVKFVRWLRSFLYREAPWEHALARLARVYATF